MTYQDRIISLLLDGQWHPFPEIYEAVRRFVPNAKAEREYQKRHADWAQHPGGVRVEKGKRRLVILHLISMKHRLQIEGRGESGDQDFRMTRDEIKRRLRRESRRKAQTSRKILPVA